MHQLRSTLAIILMSCAIGCAWAQEVCAAENETPAGSVPSVEWLRANLPKLLDDAIDNPSAKNIEAYLYAQRVMMDKAQAFAIATMPPATANEVDAMQKRYQMRQWVEAVAGEVVDMHDLSKIPLALLLAIAVAGAAAVAWATWFSLNFLESLVRLGLSVPGSLNRQFVAWHYGRRKTPVEQAAS